MSFFFYFCIYLDDRFNYRRDEIRSLSHIISMLESAREKLAIWAFLQWPVGRSDQQHINDQWTILTG
jgi:hypothetical protein